MEAPGFAQITDGVQRILLKQDCSRWYFPNCSYSSNPGTLGAVPGLRASTQRVQALSWNIHRPQSHDVASPLRPKYLLHNCMDPLGKASNKTRSDLQLRALIEQKVRTGAVPRLQLRDMCVCTCTHIYIYIERERGAPKISGLAHSVAIHVMFLYVHVYTYIYIYVFIRICLYIKMRNEVMPLG